MNNLEQKREKWRHKKSRAWSVFHAVMEYYYECKANLGACQPVNYDSNTGSSPGYIYGKVVMIPSDYISDVALIGKRILDEGQFKYFKYRYLDKNEYPGTTINSTDITVQEILGNYFFKVGLFPAYKYMKTVKK